jgi:hypothetical protein
MSSNRSGAVVRAFPEEGSAEGSAPFNGLEASIPSLRRYAAVLVRGRDEQDDLVHDCLVRALDRWHTRRGQASHSAGPSSRWPPDEAFTEIHPKRRLGCDSCPTGRGCRRLRGRALGHIKTPCEPVVDIAALVLRTRCCGGSY